MTRIYGKVVNRWYHTVNIGEWCERDVVSQYEVAYTDYRKDGTVYQTGTEDFSPERFRDMVAYKWVHTWDGQKFNKGGKRCFDCQGSIRYRKGEGRQVKALMQVRYPQAAAIELR